MGNLVTAIGGLLKDLGRFLLIIGLIIIPYGLIQENFIYPNQFLQSLEEKYVYIRTFDENNRIKEIDLTKVINPFLQKCLALSEINQAKTLFHL